MPEDRRQGEDRRRKPPATKKGFFIHKTDGTIADVPCRALAEVNFEQHFKAGLGRESFAGAQSSTRAYWLAWECERISGVPVLPFEEWVGTVEAIDSWEEALPLARRAPGTPSLVSVLPPESRSNIS